MYLRVSYCRKGKVANSESWWHKIQYVDKITIAHYENKRLGVKMSEYKPRPGVILTDEVASSPKEIPESLTDEASRINVGFIGFPRAGKTMFLLTLDKALMNSRWQIRPSDQMTIDFLIPLKGKLTVFGTVPQMTEQRDILSFEVHRNGNFWGTQHGTWPPIIIKVLEAPGGDSVPGGILKTGYDSRTLRYISTCSAVLFLIDPEELWKSSQEAQSMGEGLSLEESQDRGQAFYDFTFEQIFNQLLLYRDIMKAVYTTKTYIAFCLTKMDMFPKEWNSPEVFARSILGEVAMKRIESLCKNNPSIECKWFSVSSVGFREEDGKAMSRLSGKGDSATVLRPNNLQPVGSQEAIEWLLESLVTDMGGDSFMKRFRRLLGG